MAGSLFFAARIIFVRRSYALPKGGEAVAKLRGAAALLFPVFFGAALLFFPDVSAAAAREGVALCLQTVLPSLFPFFVLSSLLVQSDVPRLLSRAMAGVMYPLFGVSGAGAKRVAVLEDVMNPTNVGAIFRSAAALGIDAVLLTQACSDPLYRRAIRVSMGTVFQVPWARIGEDAADWPQKGVERLHALGFRTAAMALTDNSVSIDDARLAAEPRLAIVLGTEGDGLSPRTIAACDYTVKIPMAHGVDSLNVAAASAVAFWQLRAK